MKRSNRVLFALVSAAALAGCGGAGGTLHTTVPIAKTPNAASATFVVKVPAKSSNPASRRPAYITSNVQAIDFTVTNPATPGASAYTFYPLTSKSSYCTSGSSGLTCTLAVVAPPGADTFVVNLYDAVESGQAYIIATGNVTATISAQQSNTVNIVTNGVPTFAVLGAEKPYPPGGTATTVPLDIQVTDPDGNIIVGSFDMPLTLANSDTSGATSLSKTTLNQTSDETGVTLNYSGSGTAAASVTLNSTSPSYASRGGSPVLAATTVTPGGVGPAVAPAALDFAHANSAPQTLTVTGENGSTGPFSVSGCGGYVVISGTSPTFTITPVASTFSATSPAYLTPGPCQLTVTDSASNMTAVNVLVGQ